MEVEILWAAPSLSYGPRYRPLLGDGCRLFVHPLDNSEVMLRLLTCKYPEIKGSIYSTGHI